MKRIELLFLIAVIMTSLLLTTITVSRFVELTGSSENIAHSLGKPRTIDSERILSLIRQNKLADHSARFYTPALDTNMQVVTPEKQ